MNEQHELPGVIIRIRTSELPFFKDHVALCSRDFDWEHHDTPERQRILEQLVRRQEDRENERDD